MEREYCEGEASGLFHAGLSDWSRADSERKMLMGCQAEEPGGRCEMSARQHFCPPVEAMSRQRGDRRAVIWRRGERFSFQACRWERGEWQPEAELPHDGSWEVAEVRWQDYWAESRKG